MKKLHFLTSAMLALLVVFSAMALAVERLPFYRSADFTPHWLAKGSSEITAFHQIPSFRFLNQDGEWVTEQTFDDKIYVASFFFSSCPGICPAIRSKLIDVQNHFANDDSVLLLSHSIRPSTDTVEVLKHYATLNNIQSGKWHLVTGDKATIYQLAKASYFANEDLGSIEKSDDFLHTENLVLIDKNKHIRGVYNGLNAASVQYLIADINSLKAE